MRTALSERPVRGTIACVCLVNETQKTLEVNKMDGFSKYNFIFELNGIRVWRADGVGKGIVIPYQDTIVKPQGPTDLVVDVYFFSVKEARIHKDASSDEEQSSGLFLCSEPGCQMVFKKFSDLESHLDVGEHRQERRGSETVYMTNSEEVGRKNSILLRTTRRSAAHYWHIPMSIVTKMKLPLLIVTYNLAGLYTSRAVKLCGLRMRLNST